MKPEDKYSNTPTRLTPEEVFIDWLIELASITFLTGIVGIIGGIIFLIYYLLHG